MQKAISLALEIIGCQYYSLTYDGTLLSLDSKSNLGLKLTLSLEFCLESWYLHITFVPLFIFKKLLLFENQ